MIQRMARALEWMVGYLSALAWGWCGRWYFWTSIEDDDSEFQVIGLLVLLLLWVGVPAVGARVGRNRAGGRRRPVLGGLLFGGVLATVYLVLVGVLVVSGGGIYFAWLLTRPIVEGLFFAVPPVWYGWVRFLLARERRSE